MPSSLRAPLGRTFSVLLLAVMLFGSSGCGLRILYNNLDRVTVWFVADMLDLDRQQRRELRTAAANLLEWHRHEQLPEYAAFLAEIDQRIGGAIAADDLVRWQARMERWYVELAEASLPIAIVTLRDLRTEQIDAFADNMAEYSTEAEEEFAGQSLAERRERWRKETRRELAERIGRLTPEQKAIILRASLEWQPDDEPWARFRRAWQADLIRLLRARPPLAEFSRELRALWVDAEARYPTDLTAAIAHNEALLRRLLVDVLATLNDDQRRHLQRALRALASDFRALAREE